MTVCITGLGAATPLGLSYKDLWSGLCSGKCGISRITSFDPASFKCQIAGQVPAFGIRDYVPKAIRKTTKLMSRDIEIAIVAANDAFKDAGISTKAFDEQNITIDPKRSAIILGANSISCDLLEIAPSIAKGVVDGKFDIRKWGTDSIETVTPLWLLKYLPNMLACHIGIIHDLQGPSNTITCAESAGLLAIGEAYQIILRGDAELALAGGGESKVNPIVHMRQSLLKRANDNSNDKPEEACRPFDENANGCIFGEAAACVVMESFEKAQGRNAKVYATIAGFGQSCSLNTDYEALEPDGKGVQYAIEAALEEAKIKPEEIDLIVPHGTAVVKDDIAEAAGIRAALGQAGEMIPVLPTKSMVSNTGSGAGAVDVVAACCCMNEGLIPAAKNCTTVNKNCKLNVVQEPIKKGINYALCTTYTYGGQTAAIILKKA